MRMSSAQLAALFEGLDWRLVRPERGAASAGGRVIVGEVREAPVFAGPNLERVIHSGAWTPMPSAARTPI